MSNRKSVSRRIRYAFVYRMVLLLIGVSYLVPRRWWLSFCGALGSLAYVFATQTRKLVVRHLSMAFPEKSQDEIIKLAKKTFRMLGKNGGEILRASRIKHLSQLEKFLVTHGYENFERAHKKGNGVIFVSCHLGAFDLQVASFALRGWNPNVVGTPLKNQKLNDLLWKFRNAYGATAIERGKETFRMLKVLKSGGFVALLIDQDTKVKNVFVNFFGMPAATPVGATILAMKTGAAIVPTFIHLGEDNLQHMHMLPQIEMRLSGNEEEDIVYNTQLLTNFIEEQVRKYPEQWVWMHERWKTQPEAVR